MKISYLAAYALCSIVMMCVVAPSIALAQKSPKNTVKKSALAPLQKSDCEIVLKAIKQDSRWLPGSRFIMVGIAEPAKYQPVSTQTRQAMASVFHQKSNTMFEVFVNLETKTVSEFRVIPNVQPSLVDEDFDTVAAIVKRNGLWQAAMKKRGFTNFDDLSVDAWASGIPTSSYPTRMARAVTYVLTDGVNNYDRPIEGVVALVDVTNRTVVEIHDNKIATVPQPYKLPEDFAKESKRPPLTKFTTTIKNSNLNIQGEKLSWQNWRCNIVFQPREGLVIRDLKYVDNGVERSVAHRISLTEMLVPYGDTSNAWIWRNAFDVGEYGFGALSYSLVPGSDVPTYSTMIPSVFIHDSGNIEERANVLAVYERQNGPAWRHVNPFNKEIQSRPNHELVLSYAATIGNYDYIISYVLGNDGSITTDVGLTGVMLPKGTTDTVYTGTDNQMFATIVAKNILAPTHQHFFNFRYDLDIDGQKNIASEIDVSRPRDKQDDPHQSAIMMDEWQLRTELEGARKANSATARHWKIESTTKNSLGMNTAYVLAISGATAPFLDTATYVRLRAGFVNYPVWFTAYNEREMYAAGDYPNQSVKGLGLPLYLNNEWLYNKDVVLWYTAGVTHVARPEDWNIMPTAHATMKLMPHGFFDHNPTLDLKK